MKTLSFICFFFLSLPFISDSNLDTTFSIHDDWKLVSTDGDLKVYKRKKEGSSYKEIKIENIINAKVDEVVAALADADSYKDWIYKCAHSEKIKTINDSEFIYYTIADLPSPLWDRDIVAHSRYKYDANANIHYFNSVEADGYIEDKDDKIVRVPKFNTAWTIKDLGSNKVSIINKLHFEPAGNIPAWIVNLSIAKGPKKTMKGLQTVISEQ